MTRSNALAGIHNLILRYKEEYENLNVVSQDRHGADYFEALVRDVLEYCEEADDYYQE